MASSDYLLRSLMFVPGHNDRLLASAARSDADVLLLDVEDAVPAKDKQAARDGIIGFVKDAPGDYLIFPRINDRESGQLLKDVTQLAIEGVDGFMYPKSRDGKDIYFFDKLLETVEYERELPIGAFKIIPLIETCGAVLNAQEICQASSRVIAVAFGCEDFIADLTGIHDTGGDSLFTARAMIAMAARASGVTPIDTVHIHVHDLDDLERNLVIAKNLGFGGMLVLHPKEIPLVHQYFSPSDDEVTEAREMLRLSGEAEREGKGVAVMDGRFIGPPMVITAKRILRLHEMIAKRDVVKRRMGFL